MQQENKKKKKRRDHTANRWTRRFYNMRTLGEQETKTSREHTKKRKNFQHQT